MTNSTALSKNLKAKLKRINLKIDDISKKVSTLESDLGYKMTKKSQNKRNSNGLMSEHKVASFISKIDGFSSVSQYVMKLNDFESQVACGQKYLTIDSVIYNDLNNNSLFTEIKCQHGQGTIRDKNFKYPFYFSHFKKKMLLLVVGDYYTDSVISDFNNSMIATGVIEFNYMVHFDNFQKFIDLWKHQESTDFESIHLKMIN